MRKIKLFNESTLDPFGEENWIEEKDIPIDYISIYISYYSIIITENQLTKEDDNYIYLSSLHENDIPYTKNALKNDELYIEDNDFSEWLIKINDRNNIKKYKVSIENYITNNLKKYFKKSNYNFEANLYNDIDIRIQLDEFDQYINKYFFKNK